MLPLSLQKSVVFTPEVLANAITGVLGTSDSDKWLEPCVGNGSFLQAISNLGGRPEQITGIDLDDTIHENDALGSVTRGIDFVSWASVTSERFSKIVCNPPYISLSKLSEELQAAATSIGCEGLPVIRKRANYWCSFLYAALSVLEPGGSMVFILPASWGHATYSRVIREQIPSRFARFEVHRCRRPLFQAVQDGCVVIIGHGFGQAPTVTPVRQVHETPDDLVVALQKRASYNFGRNPRRSVRCERFTPRESVQVQDVMSLVLGGVTGDAKFFALTECQREAFDLPLDSVHPILSRARQLTQSTINEEIWESLRDLNERVWLFRPTTESLHKYEVKRYLEKDPLSGGCDRSGFKIRNRTPWFVTPLPAQTDGFMSGMKSSGPWICLNEMQGLSATNTLYIVNFKDHSLSHEEKAAWSLSFLSSHTRQHLRSVGKVYGDGLIKYEPGSLMGLPLAVPTRSHGAAERYKMAIAYLTSGDTEKAVKIADEWTFGASP